MNLNRSKPYVASDVFARSVCCCVIELIDGDN